MNRRERIFDEILKLNNEKIYCSEESAIMLFEITFKMKEHSGVTPIGTIGTTEIYIDSEIKDNNFYFSDGLKLRTGML